MTTLVPPVPRNKLECFNVANSGIDPSAVMDSGTLAARQAIIASATQPTAWSSLNATVLTCPVGSAANGTEWLMSADGAGQRGSNASAVSVVCNTIPSGTTLDATTNHWTNFQSKYAGAEATHTGCAANEVVTGMRWTHGCGRGFAQYPADNDPFQEFVSLQCTSISNGTTLVNNGDTSALQLSSFGSNITAGCTSGQTVTGVTYSHVAGKNDNTDEIVVTSCSTLVSPLAPTALNSSTTSSATSSKTPAATTTTDAKSSAFTYIGISFAVLVLLASVYYFSKSNKVNEQD